MTEKLISCPKCESNACSEISDEKITIWLCMGCGFTSNIFLTAENAAKVEETLPNLYKDLKYIDANGFFMGNDARDLSYELTEVANIIRKIV
jgi:hypothetical protein